MATATTIAVPSAGGEFKDIYAAREKLSTEFGVDAPPASGEPPPGPAACRTAFATYCRAWRNCTIINTGSSNTIRTLPHQKYAPNAGYFQFMWIDFCPQSFYGIYDYWGRPKAEGIGGGLRALEESNQPVGIFLEYQDVPRALHAVNDLSADLGDCTAEWTVTGQKAGASPAAAPGCGWDRIRTRASPICHSRSMRQSNTALLLCCAVPMAASWPGICIAIRSISPAPQGSSAAHGSRTGDAPLVGRREPVNAGRAAHAAIGN